MTHGSETVPDWNERRNAAGTPSWRAVEMISAIPFMYDIESKNGPYVR
jgi:hypothetical protein